MQDQLSTLIATLDKARQDRGLTWNQVSDITGVALRTLANWRNDPKASPLAVTVEGCIARVEKQPRNTPILCLGGPLHGGKQRLNGKAFQHQCKKPVMRRLSSTRIETIAPDVHTYVLDNVRTSDGDKIKVYRHTDTPISEIDLAEFF